MVMWMILLRNVHFWIPHLSRNYKRCYCSLSRAMQIHHFQRGQGTGLLSDGDCDCQKQSDLIKEKPIQREETPAGEPEIGVKDT